MLRAPRLNPRRNPSIAFGELFELERRAREEGRRVLPAVIEGLVRRGLTQNEAEKMARRYFGISTGSN